MGRVSRDRMCLAENCTFCYFRKGRNWKANNFWCCVCNFQELVFLWDWNWRKKDYSAIGKNGFYDASVETKQKLGRRWNDFSLRRTYSLCWLFLWVLVICWRKDSLESRVRPRYLKLSTTSTLCPFTFTGSAGWSPRLGSITNSLVLDTFSWRKLVSYHW